MNQTIRKFFSVVLLAAFALVGAGNGTAEASQVDSLIETLVSKKVLTRFEAEQIRIEVENKEEPPVKITHPWMEGLTSKGDVRVRLESFDSNSNSGSRDRMRERIRLRWGLEKKFNDEWKTGFRLASGPSNEATSTNQSFDDEFSLKSVYFDRAYGMWTPTTRLKEFLPSTKKAELGAGKVANPFEKWGTSIIWDSDVVPEGIYEAFDFGVTDNIDLNLVAGQFVLEEQSSTKDVSMAGYGAGTTIKIDDKSKFTAAYTFYDWDEYDAVLRGALPSTEEAFDSTHLSGTTPGGNDLQIDDFLIHSIYLEYGTKLDLGSAIGTQAFKVYGQAVKNEGVGNGVLRPSEDSAWTVGVGLGNGKKKGEWAINTQYFHTEQNSVVGNFSESDLGTGGTNKEGIKIEFKYKLLDAVDLVWTNWFVDDVVRTSNSDPQVWRTQADIVYAF